MKEFKRKALMFGLLCFAFFAEKALSQSTDNLQSAFIYQFTKYIEWPIKAGQPFNVCTINNEAMLKNLKVSLADKSVGSRPIRVCDSWDESDVKNYNLVYVGDLSEENASSLFKTLQDNSIVSVTSQKRYKKFKASIIFFVLEERIRFKIDEVIFNKMKIKVSSQLLKLSRDLE